MGRHIGLPMVTTSVRISPEFHKLCVDNYFSFSEAMKIGISIMAAEKGIIEYDNNLNISRRLLEAKLKAAEYAKKISELESEKA